MIALHARSRLGGSQGGFTLVEVLVSFIIVGLALTVFLQLLSGSMRLSYKSRDLLDHTIRADEIFSRILIQDIRNEDFIWQAEIEKGRWNLQLEAVEVSELNADKKEITISLPAELYRLIFTFYTTDDRPVLALESVRQYPLAYFSEEFKQQHLSAPEDLEPQ